MFNNRGFGLIEVVVLVVVVAVLAGAGYVFVQGMNESKNESKKESVSTVETGHNMDAMEGWKTFVSEQYGFSFEYPENWTVATSVVETFPNQPNAIISDEAGKEVLGMYGYIGMGCETPSEGSVPTKEIVVVDTSVTVTKDCNSSWNWIQADSKDGDKIIITTSNFLDSENEDDALMLLDSTKGLRNIQSNTIAK